jgi:hypothetical protein
MKLLALFPKIFLVLIMASCNQPENLSKLDPFLKKTAAWKFVSLDRDIPIKVYYAGDHTVEEEGDDVVIYIKNKAWERIGRESDLSILEDIIRQKFIVITLDLGNDPKAVSPLLDNDINALYNAVFGYKTKSLLEEIRLVPKKYRCFVIPEGYRVATNLVYWEIDKHGAYGTLEYIMQTYNAEIAPKVPGLKAASSPGEMVDRKGNPFDFGIKMDIIYPSRAKRKLPAIVYSETQSTRNTHGGLTEDGSHLNWYQLRGYTYIVMGHCFNPCVTHYWHFINFTLDHWNGLACYTAAMRYIHMHSDKYSINTDYIGGIGISKGQYAITRLSDPDNAEGTESKKFAGFPEGTPEPQPWLGYPSTISAGWQGMGMGLWELEYITPDYVPTIIACGENDRDVITKEGHPRFVKRLEELDVNHVNLFMEGLGHDLSYGYDQRLGVDRYRFVIDFFDRYLKPGDKLPPAVLIVSPRDGSENVNSSTPIFVQMAPAIDAKPIIEKDAIRVVGARDNKAVSGSWKVSHGSTKFTFTPEQPLEQNEIYSIIISNKVKDLWGNRLDKEKRIQFRVGAEQTVYRD